MKCPHCNKLLLKLDDIRDLISKYYTRSVDFSDCLYEEIEELWEDFE